MGKYTLYNHGFIKRKDLQLETNLHAETGKNKKEYRKDIFPQSSLRSVSVVILGLTMAAIIGLLGSLIYGMRMNRNLAREYIADTAELYVNAINRDMIQINSELFTFMHYDEDIKNLSDDVVPYHSNDYQILTRLVAQNKVLRIRYEEVQNFFVYVHSAKALITDNGTNFSTSLRTALNESLMDYLDQHAMENTLAPSWVNMEVDGTHYIIGWYSKMGKVSGCVVNLNTIFHKLQSETTEYEVVPYLECHDGQVIFPDELTDEQIVRIKKEQTRGEDRYRAVLGSVGTMYFYVNQGTGVLRTVYSAQMLLTGLTMLLLLICILAFYIYYRRIMAPIERFSERLGSMSEVTFLDEYEKNHVLELENANSKFRELLARIQSLKIAIYEKELNEQRAELEYAQEQIRPHFFLNCISLIHGIADRQAEKEILHITEVLSDYLRYIFRDYKKQMAIQSELEHVNAYVEIQKLRYGEEAFSYEVILDGDVQDCLVPSLLLQTLVENSVVHAVNLDRPIEISLYITREEYRGEEVVYICLSDSGNGFSDEILQAIEEDTPIIYNGRKHVGLQNIRRRLRLLHGDKAEVIFSNMDQNYGAVVEVRVPVMKEE